MLGSSVGLDRSFIFVSTRFWALDACQNAINLAMNDAAKIANIPKSSIFHNSKRYSFGPWDQISLHSDHIMPSKTEQKKQCILLTSCSFYMIFYYVQGISFVAIISKPFWSLGAWIETKIFVHVHSYICQYFLLTCVIIIISHTAFAYSTPKAFK